MDPYAWPSESDAYALVPALAVAYYLVVRRHPTYEKVVRRSSKLHAHDESNTAQEGDVVRVIESRPLSRTKRWRLLDVVERSR